MIWKLDPVKQKNVRLVIISKTVLVAAMTRVVQTSMAIDHVTYLPEDANTTASLVGMETRATGDARSNAQKDCATEPVSALEI